MHADPSLTAADLAQGVLHSLLSQSAGGSQGGLVSILPPVLFMVVIFYFLMWRPQQKQARQHREMVSSLKKGDEIITTAGIVGRIFSVSEKFLVVEIARDVRVRLLKSAVQGKAPEGTVDGVEAKVEKDKTDKEK